MWTRNVDLLFLGRDCSTGFIFYIVSVFLGSFLHTEDDQYCLLLDSDR